MYICFKYKRGREASLQGGFKIAMQIIGELDGRLNPATPSGLQISDWVGKRKGKAVVCGWSKLGHFDQSVPNSEFMPQKENLSYTSQIHDLALN